jgi:hypothetical protein
MNAAQPLAVTTTAPAPIGGPGVEVAPRQRPGLVRRVEMEAHRPATASPRALGERHADLAEHPLGGGVELRRRSRLHAAGQEHHPPLPLEGRGQGWGALRAGRNADG